MWVVWAGWLTGLVWSGLGAWWHGGMMAGQLVSIVVSKVIPQ